MALRLQKGEGVLHHLPPRLLLHRPLGTPPPMSWGGVILFSAPSPTAPSGTMATTPSDGEVGASIAILPPAAETTEGKASPPVDPTPAATMPKGAVKEGDAPSSPLLVASQQEDGTPLAASSSPSLPATLEEGGMSDMAPLTPATCSPTAAAASLPRSPASPSQLAKASPTAGVFKPPAAAPPIKELRRSSRIAAMADVHTLQKSERLTAKKNLEFIGNLQDDLHKVERMAAKKNFEFPRNSFASFPDPKVISNLGRIDINLDTSDILCFKNLEVDRLVLCANEKKCSIKSRLSNFESDDERESQIDAILSHACGNLNGNLLEDESDQLIDLSPLPRKKNTIMPKIL